MIRLRRERLKRQWTQTDLAERAKITVAELSRFENQLQVPYPVQLERLSQVLDVPEDLLLRKVPGKILQTVLKPKRRRSRTPRLKFARG